MHFKLNIFGTIIFVLHNRMNIIQNNNKNDKNDKNTYIDLISETNNTMKFVWHNPNQSIIHAVQRIITSDLYTLAIDMVMIDQNSSILSDQELALSLGLIPMESTHAETFLLPDECDCENFCKKCSVKMSLTVACYGDRYNVTSKDLYFEDPRTRPIHESGIPNDPELLGQDGFGPGIFIVPLAKNQKIRLSCTVRKGTGRIHGKWNPVSKAVFIPAPIVKVNMKKFHNLNNEMEDKLREELDEQIRGHYKSIVQKKIGDALREQFDARFDARFDSMIESMTEDQIYAYFQKLNDQLYLLDITGGRKKEKKFSLAKRETVDEYREDVFQSWLAKEVERGLDMIVSEKIDDLVEEFRVDWKKTMA